MQNKFKNKYTIASSRLPGYDYSQNGMYFVTICTKGHEEFFGRIEDGEMVLSEIGIVANKFWQEIPKHFPFVILDEFVVMPNHVHGVLEINNLNSVETQFIACRGMLDANNDNVDVTTRRDAINRISTLNRIREYIQTSPQTWGRDRNNPGNISKAKKPEIFPK